MIFRATDVPRIKIDDAMTILQYTSSEHSAKFNAVVGQLDGDHGLTTNRVSDRAYYILKGKGRATVGAKVYEVTEGDLVLISSGTPHGISGKLEFLIITAPAFNPADEQ
ncbi:MAG: cupin domain-containing protein [Chloroflexota bacterium]|nr:cupin domain-containing protein [Chloroflexota bacterium]